MPVLVAPAEQKIGRPGSAAQPTVEDAPKVAGCVGPPIDRQIEPIELGRDDALELAGEGAVAAHKRRVLVETGEVRPLGQDEGAELAPRRLDVAHDLSGARI